MGVHSVEITEAAYFVTKSITLNITTKVVPTYSAIVVNLYRPLP